jgi:hypothetical protein
MDILLTQDSTNDAVNGKDPEFFDPDYRASTIGIGFVWFFMTIINPILFAAIRPDRRCLTWYGSKTCVSGYWTKGEKHAWNVVRIANGIFFGFLTLFWLLSYIHNRYMQKLYYRVIAWMIPASWIFAFWSLLAFIIGGSQDGGKFGKDIGYWFLTTIMLAGSEALAWWQAPDMIKFYRWDAQEWWNYTKEDSP